MARVSWKSVCAAALLTFAALAPLPAAAAPSEEDIAELVAASGLTVETFTLKNGMDVVVIPDHRMPVVTHMVWYKIGAADEVAGKSGLAHFLEHLMFKGTKKIGPGEYSKLIARNGGQDNAFTSWDYTAYYQRIALDRLETVMKMDVDRMTNLRLTDDIVLPERDVIMEERRQRTDNRPESILAEQMDAALYQNHRYGVPIIGWLHEMAGLTTEDALNWYKTYYSPSDATLIVAGDITAAELKPLAEKTYGKVRKRDIPERHRVSEPPSRAPRRVLLEDERAEQPSMTRTYLTVTDKQGIEGKAAAIDVLAKVLGGGPTSRLYKSLVIDKQIAASAGASYWSTRLDYGEFSVYGTPRPGVPLDKIEGAIDAVIADLAAHPPTEDEVREAAFGLIADAAYARDDQQGLAYMIGAGLMSGLSVDEILAWPQRIAAVTPADVAAVAAEYLTMERSVTGYLKTKETK